MTTTSKRQIGIKRQAIARLSQSFIDSKNINEDGDQVPNLHQISPATGFQPLLTARLRLEPLRQGHSHCVLAYYRQNATHLKPWEPARSAAFFEPRTFEAALATWVAACESGQSRRFVIKRINGAADTCIGIINFTHISPMPTLACALGYGLDEAHQGQGLMREALRALTQHMFETHGLHRIMANHMPSNLKSAATLRALGFEVEGLARAYLHINGRWEDHVLTALINPAFH